MIHSENKTPLFIVQVEPPQKADGGDYFYRTHAPGIAMAQEEGVYVVNITNQHRRKIELTTNADILILNNICDPDILPLIKARKSNGKLTVYEIADDLYALQPWNPVYVFYKNKENLALVNHLMICCDALQVSSPELKRLYEHLNENCKVFPNQILNIPPEKPKKKDNKVVIGWGGSHGHLEDMEEIADSLIKWISALPNVSLHLMCSETIWELFDTLPDHKKKRTLPGTIDDYYNFLRKIDIGIAPMKDTAFNRSRSDIKFLEYAVSEVVPVMANLEPYINSVSDGKTGFLYDKPIELIAILNRLTHNPSLVQETAKASRQYVIRERQQLQHGQDRISFYKDLLRKLQIQDLKNNGKSGFLEELPEIEGTVRNKRHFRLGATRFENLLHDGLVAMQVNGDKKLAHRFFEEAATLEPGNYLPFLFGSSVSQDPIDSLLNALELKPDSIKAWILLGEELERRGNVTEALESYEYAAKVYPEYDIPYLRVAVFLKKLGKQSQSDWFFRKAKELEIQHPLPAEVNLKNNIRIG